MSKGKIILFVVIGTLLMAAVVFGVVRLNNPLRDSFSGTIEAEEIRILAEVEGQITEISVGEGDLVQKGDLLCQIHSTLLSSQVEQAKAVVSASQAQLSKAKNGATLEDLAIAQANLEYAQATFTLATEMLAKGQVKAPQSGTILERDINPSELVSQGGMLFGLADLDRLFLYIYLAQDQIGWAQLGQNVTVKVDAYPKQSFRGTVTYISPKAQFTPKNVQTREQRTVLTFAAKIEIADPQHLLRIGIPADVLLAAPSP